MTTDYLDYLENIHYLNRAAAKSRSMNPLEYADRCLDGADEYIPRNPAKARELYAAAEKVRPGDANIQSHLGACHMALYIETSDNSHLDKAAHWYRRAEMRGDSVARLICGIFHEYGFGICKKPDPLAAARYYEKAKNQGLKIAAQLLSALNKKAAENSNSKEFRLCAFYLKTKDAAKTARPQPVQREKVLAL